MGDSKNGQEEENGVRNRFGGESKTVYTIRPFRPSDGPRCEAGCFKSIDNTIVINPDANAKVTTEAGDLPASLPRILGHEMGHAATGAADPGDSNFVSGTPQPGLNVIENENPIVTELGEPARTIY